jgi:hypothetical protein
MSSTVALEVSAWHWTKTCMSDLDIYKLLLLIRENGSLCIRLDRDSSLDAIHWPPCRLPVCDKKLSLARMVPGVIVRSVGLNYARDSELSGVC